MIGLFGHFEKCGFSFPSVSESPHEPCEWGGGLEEEKGGVCGKVLHKCFIEPNTHQSDIEMLTKYKERKRWHRKQCSRR